MAACDGRKAAPLPPRSAVHRALGVALPPESLHRADTATSLFFLRALVLGLWSDQPVLQGGEWEGGGCGQVALAGEHPVPGSVHLQWLPRPPPVGPHGCALLSEVSQGGGRSRGLCFLAWGPGEPGVLEAVAFLLVTHCPPVALQVHRP